MTEIDKQYAFEGKNGKASLLDLFEGRGQLLIYHFMFDPDWDEGCPSCSFLADNIGHLAHLHARDTTLAMVSRAPLARIEAFRQRMGWAVPWYSSFGSDFNYDFHVTLDQAVAPVEYNYRDVAALGPEWHGGAVRCTASAPFSAVAIASSTPTPATRAAPTWSMASTTGSISPPEAAKKTGNSHPGAATAL
jgi:predicted dithiol-disulfide oxidoreductase (DUF899 family)